MTSATRGVRYHALIPAGGIGTRFGAGVPKQYALLEGKPILQHAIERLAAALPLHRTYVALSVHDHWFAATVREHEGVAALRCGGATRAETVRNALRAMADVAPDDWIVVHDAVRPCIDAESLRRLARELADEPVGGLLAIPVSATLKRADDGQRSVRTESREGLWRAQTPQMFRYGVLRDALSRPGSELATDEAQAVEQLGACPRLVAGSTTNLKITYPEDLLLAAAILQSERAP